MVDPTQGLESKPVEGRDRHIATGGDERRGSATHGLRPRLGNQATHRPPTAVRGYRRSPSEVDPLWGEPGTACRDRSLAIEREEPRRAITSALSLEGVTGTTQFVVRVLGAYPNPWIVTSIAARRSSKVLTERTSNVDGPVAGSCVRSRIDDPAADSRTRPSAVSSETTSAGIAEGPIDHAAAVRPRERMSDRTHSRSEATAVAPNRTRATVTDQKCSPGAKVTTARSVMMRSSSGPIHTKAEDQSANASDFGVPSHERSRAGVREGGTFAELKIDGEERPSASPVLVGMLQEGSTGDGGLLIGRMSVAAVRGLRRVRPSLWSEHETKQIQKRRNAIHEEIFARAKAAGWDACVRLQAPVEEEGQEGAFPTCQLPGYVFTRAERALFVRWYPAADVSTIKQVLESMSRSP